MYYNTRRTYKYKEKHGSGRVHTGLGGKCTGRAGTGFPPDTHGPGAHGFGRKMHGPGRDGFPSRHRRAGCRRVWAENARAGPGRVSLPTQTGQKYQKWKATFSCAEWAVSIALCAPFIEAAPEWAAL
jgi:hypothetical protein